MKKFILGITFLFGVGLGGKPAEAYPYFFHSGYGVNYAGWGWYPLAGIGTLPYYGYSYWPYYNYFVYYASYGAISYSLSTGAVGWSWGNATQQGAFDRANGYCAQSDCRPVVWVQGGCASVATSSDRSRLGWGYDGSRHSAQSRALRACQAGAGAPADCAVLAWVCSWN